MTHKKPGTVHFYYMNIASVMHTAVVFIQDNSVTSDAYNVEELCEMEKEINMAERGGGERFKFVVTEIL
jgi:hypothetical protein